MKVNNSRNLSETTVLVVRNLISLAVDNLKEAKKSRGSEWYLYHRGKLAAYTIAAGHVVNMEKFRKGGV